MSEKVWQTYRINVWFMSMCINDLGQETEYPSYYAAQMCHLKYDSYCINLVKLSPLWAALIILYPQCGMCCFTSFTHSSNSSFVRLLYRAWMERLHLAIDLNTVRVFTPIMLAIVETEQLMSRRCVMLYGEIGPDYGTIVTLHISPSDSLGWISLRSSERPLQNILWDGNYIRNSTLKTTSCEQINSRLSMSRGRRPTAFSKREQSLSKT